MRSISHLPLVGRSDREAIRVGVDRAQAPTRNAAHSDLPTRGRWENES